MWKGIGDLYKLLFYDIKPTLSMYYKDAIVNKLTVYTILPTNK
jgi:hypothetical protein